VTEKRKRSKKRKDKSKGKQPAMTNGLSKDFISDRSNENLLDPSSPEKLPEKVNIDYKPATGEIQMVEIAVDV